MGIGFANIIILSDSVNKRDYTRLYNGVNGIYSYSAYFTAKG
ncbi:MAG: hypothetical protein H6Q69_1196 [Firmicutes bacterium]|nr:hypothetical protein [Bacillota bacterium]